MCLPSYSSWWVGDNPKNGLDIYKGLSVVFSHHNVTCITSADCPLIFKLTPSHISHNPFTPMSIRGNVPCPFIIAPSQCLFQILDILKSTFDIKSNNGSGDAAALYGNLLWQSIKTEPLRRWSMHLGSVFPSSMRTAITVLIIITTGGMHAYIGACLPRCTITVM